MLFLTNIDLNKNQLLNAVTHNLATTPSNPVEGQSYYNTVSKRTFTWNGTTWTGNDAQGSTMTGADIVTAINASASLIDLDNLAATVGTAVTNSHAHSNKALLDTYSQTETNLASAVSLKHTQNTDTGTTSATFTVGSSGVKIKNSSGTELQVRNNGDTAYADLRVNNLYVTGTTTTIDSSTVSTGDSNIELNSDITTSAANSDGGITIKRLMADNTTRKDAVLNFNNSTGKWENTGGAVTGTLVTAQIANKVTAQIGNGSATSIVVTHNLNTQDAIVSIREVASPYGLVMTDVEFTTVNTITCKFAVAPTTNQYQVSIIG